MSSVGLTAAEHISFSWSQRCLNLLRTVTSHDLFGGGVQKSWTLRRDWLPTTFAEQTHDIRILNFVKGHGHAFWRDFCLGMLILWSTSSTFKVTFVYWSHVSWSVNAKKTLSLISLFESTDMCHLVGGWKTFLKNMEVSWDYEIPNMYTYITIYIYIFIEKWNRFKTTNQWYLPWGPWTATWSPWFRFCPHPPAEDRHAFSFYLTLWHQNSWILPHQLVCLDGSHRPWPKIDELNMEIPWVFSFHKGQCPNDHERPTVDGPYTSHPKRWSLSLASPAGVGDTAHPPNEKVRKWTIPECGTHRFPNSFPDSSADENRAWLCFS